MRINYIVLTDVQAGGEVLRGSVNARQVFHALAH
jgi:hypothetical protein